jgi:hypothetical protein
MHAPVPWWLRLVRAADALWLTKLVLCGMAYWFVRQAAAFALGSAFSLPLLVALGVYLYRELYAAATGHHWRRRPPERLGASVAPGDTLPAAGRR